VKAESVHARAAAGEDFAQLARELSDGPEKTQGGKLTDPVARSSRSQAFDETVLPLPVGELSPVFAVHGRDRPVPT
jgi:parvulin-like peptidyl-prolyl isomerase